MGYFSNSDEGHVYEQQWCNNCIHQDDPCAVWFLQIDRNYQDCNVKDSPLHALIPRLNGKPEWNGQCKMFREIPPTPLLDGIDCIETPKGA